MVRQSFNQQIKREGKAWTLVLFWNWFLWRKNWWRQELETRFLQFFAVAFGANETLCSLFLIKTIDDVYGSCQIFFLFLRSSNQTGQVWRKDSCFYRASAFSSVHGTENSTQASQVWFLCWQPDTVRSFIRVRLHVRLSCSGSPGLHGSVLEWQNFRNIRWWASWHRHPASHSQHRKRHSIFLALWVQEFVCQRSLFAFLSLSRKNLTEQRVDRQVTSAGWRQVQVSLFLHSALGCRGKNVSEYFSYFLPEGRGPRDPPCLCPWLSLILGEKVLCHKTRKKKNRKGTRTVNSEQAGTNQVTGPQTFLFPLWIFRQVVSNQAGPFK